jgi:hypothetical protein
MLSDVWDPRPSAMREASIFGEPVRGQQGIGRCCGDVEVQLRQRRSQPQRGALSQHRDCFARRTAGCSSRLDGPGLGL